MVLFKRKGVSYLSRPPIADEADEIWVIPQTEEVFISYESYLQRMDWYKQKKFTCEVSGRSGMVFFDAQRSELAGSREVEQAFPEPLKSPVLRRVQFSTTSRIDNLVDEVFDDFKNDFYPTEIVTVVLDDGSRLNGKVRDKAKFAAAMNPDGTVKRKAFARYFVRLMDRPDEEALVDDEHIVRDRKIFTKQMLRSFIKNCVHREAWTGAPWLVKPHMAEELNISQDIPEHLRHEHKVAERKAMRKAERQEGKYHAGQAIMFQGLMPPPGQRPPQWTAEQIAAMQQPGNYEAYQQPPFPAYGWPQPHMPPQYNNVPPGYQISMHPPGGYYLGPPQLAPKFEPAPPPAPVHKGPLDDMDVEPQRNGVVRPPLKFVTTTQIASDEDEELSTGVIPGLEEPTVGLLLEIWNTLNVYCQVLLLDSFTFDDFVDALQFSSDEIDCELFIEMHCAVLKKLVNPENEQNGAIQISLPDLPDPSDSEDDEDEEEESKEPTPEPEYPAKRTRSSLNKVQFIDQQDQEMNGTSEQEDKTHRASEMFGEYGWIQRLRRRDFQNGGWEMVMVGLLHQLAGRPRLTPICDKILSHLAPLDADPTIETVRLQYSTMDINLRAQALQTVCQLFLETKAVKTFLEEMSNTMTQFRKVKIEHQRARKDAIAKVKNLTVERRVLAPSPEKSPSPMLELEDGAELLDLDKLDDGDTSIPDSDDEEPINTRSLRRGQDRAAERKRKREEEAEREAKKKEDKQQKGSKEYQKVLKMIDKERDRIDEAEEQIMIVDTDLREADCPRTRVLGKDRFCNRYWWFERNAMPHGGLPDSSTADAEYANGRLWVQGPDDMEREGYLDVGDEVEERYANRFQVTPAQRKKVEEGPTQLHTAQQWGFYDNPEDIDLLIAWLDVRGIRELKLKKELNAQRDVIAKYMENRKAYLVPREMSEEPTTRMSTRTKTYVSEAAHRCLRWRNQTAIDQQGHRHQDPPPPKKGRAKKVQEPDSVVTRGKAGRAGSEAPVLNRQGKPVTRQGSRYNF